jgi:hypothetical protein
VAGRGGSGKRLTLLPLIRRFEAEVEADLQRFHGIDYRDRFRPGGGASHLTIRRLLVLVEFLPAESQFHAAREDRSAASLTANAVMDVWESLTNQKHPGRASTAQRRQQAIEAAERTRLIARRRREARAHNARFLAARRKK